MDSDQQDMAADLLARVITILPDNPEGERLQLEIADFLDSLIARKYADEEEC